MKTKDINWYLELAFGNSFEPLLEATEGKDRLQCTQKMADAMRKGVTIRGEEIKAHTKRTRDADSRGEEEPSDDDGGGMQETWSGKECRQGWQGRQGQEVIHRLLKMPRRPQVDSLPRGGLHLQERAVYPLWQEGPHRENVHGGSSGEGSLPS